MENDKKLEVEQESRKRKSLVFPKIAAKGCETIN